MLFRDSCSGPLLTTVARQERLVSLEAMVEGPCAEALTSRLREREGPGALASMFRRVQAEEACCDRG